MLAPAHAPARTAKLRAAWEITQAMDETGAAA
jgi:hypothetical protein